MTIADAVRKLASHETTATQLVSAAFARIGDPNGEGARVFVRLFEHEARAAAAGWDVMRAAGLSVPLLAGVPISVKDLFDVAGTTTTAGSRALADAPAARADARVIARLRAAGAVIVGATNMTEFAMGGLGINPHYGTPKNPYDRASARIPGGSSSGAAISITDGMAVAAIGTDTAGSVRMPAALCGIVGFKPTARRIPLDGSVPLATTLDSIGPLGASVACCAFLDAILAGEQPSVPEPIPLFGLRFAVPQTLVLDDLEPAVAAAFAKACETLAKAGAKIVDIPFAELDEVGKLNSSQVRFSIVEGFAWHRGLLAEKRALYDPNIAVLFARGESIDAADYFDLRTTRDELVARTRSVTAGFDAVLMPTVPLTAPKIADLEADTALHESTNVRMIRNPGIANLLDRCAISLPIHELGTAPIGLTLMGESMTDRCLFAIALSAEAALTKG
jgi:aspartyl-tRNA(Asn)/glutamyl-tRNA(Gln) amidotransferase subunit A